MNLMRIIDRIPSIKQRVVARDIDTLSPSERSKLQYVPTIVDNSGRQYVGTQAFELLKQYEGEMELDAAPTGFGKLEFASLNGSGESEYVEHYGDFVPLP